MQFVTTSSADEVLEMVQDQHREIRQLLEAAAAATGPERAEAFSTARHYLAVHEAVEETLIHPVGARELSDPDVVSERVEEEQEAAEVVTTLEGLAQDSEEFDRILGELTKTVSDHAEAEESEELHAVLAAADEAALGRMAQGLEFVVELATQAGGPLGSRDRSPFLRLLDEAREEFGKLADQHPDLAG